MKRSCYVSLSQQTLYKHLLTITGLFSLVSALSPLQQEWPIFYFLLFSQHLAATQDNVAATQDNVAE